MDALAAGKDPHEIEAAWEPDLLNFRARRADREAKYLLYGYLPAAPAKQVSSVGALTVD